MALNKVEICGVNTAKLPVLTEAEKVFDAFGKVPDMLWEDEYQKYMDVLDKYKDIKVARWSQN